MFTAYAIVWIRNFFLKWWKSNVIQAYIWTYWHLKSRVHPLDANQYRFNQIELFIHLLECIYIAFILISYLLIEHSFQEHLILSTLTHSLVCLLDLHMNLHLITTNPFQSRVLLDNIIVAMNHILKNSNSSTFKRQSAQ